MKKSKIRITGIVSLMNYVRAQIANGLTADDAATLKTLVSKRLSEIKSLLKKHRYTPKDLPSPSYKAYQYLESIKWKNIKTLAESERKPGSSNIRIPGINTIVTQLFERVRDLEPSLEDKSKHKDIEKQAASIFNQIESHCRGIENACTRAGVSVSAMPLRSLRAYQMMKFLSNRGNFDQMLASMHRLGTLLRNKYTDVTKRKTIAFKFANSSSLFSANSSKDPITLNINICFMNASTGILDDILKAIFRKDKKAQMRVKQSAQKDEFSQILIELAAIAMPQSSSQGQHYDLQHSFQRVNNGYFKGELAEPALLWNRTINTRRMGYWSPIRKAVVINILLDSSDVPQYVLDFVMYHELLHSVLGSKAGKSKLYSHTKEFKQKERSFSRYQEAENFLQNISRSG
ncbi:MAG: hypothetical protein MUO76_18975 [Anaerolineaceae bacterium]|nr:hypothetical protein [Anaerolineaceae bacterium]